MRIEVLSGDIGHVWRFVEGFIESSLSRINDGTTKDDIYKKIQSRDKQLWVVYNDDSHVVGCVVTEVIPYKRCHRLLILITAGKRIKEWLHLLSEVEMFAKYIGCESIELFGRQGWMKVVAPYGYKLDYVAMTKDL